MIRLVPRPGHVYRRTDNKQLVGAEGDDFDPCDLDVDRAIMCGDLVKPGAPAAKAAKPKKAKPPAAAPEPAADASEG